MTSQLLRRLGAVTVAMLVAAFGAAAPAQAESTTGSISGHLTRPDGSPAAYEWVSANDVEYAYLNGIAITDENGFYSISDLVPALYRVSISRGGLTQYAHGKTTSDGADLFAVTAGNVTTVDERLLGVGTLQIAVTRPDGTPAQGEASLHHLNSEYGSSASAWLDASGQASLEVFAGEYKVQISPTDAPAQWLYGKTSFEEANVIAVAPDTTTIVTERLLTTGSVTVTARDSTDGSPVTNFCANAGGSEGCSGDTGSVNLTGILPGTHELRVYTEDRRYFATETTVSVVAGGTVPAVVDLVRGGTITTTVVDAATGKPVAGACLELSTAGTGRLPGGTGSCSDAEGRITIGPLHAEAYNLFVKPESGSGYGAQWVSPKGGTGDLAQARVVTVEPPDVTVVPTIRLDRAGTIFGVVTSAATGQPVTSGVVSLWAFGNTGPSFGTDIDESGRYSLDWLGPYEWPLLFVTGDHARQWSGRVADRREAKLIEVKTGKTTTYSPALKVGTVVTGTVTDAAGKPLTVYFEAFNAETGDNMGGGYSARGAYRSLVLGPQTVKIKWYLFGETASYEGWYEDAVDFEHATPVDVPKKDRLTFDMVIAAG